MKQTDNDRGDNKERKKDVPFLTPVSRCPELCKVLLLVTFGYCFGFGFVLDYSVPEMNLFYRWSTTSQIGLLHPVLFNIYAILLIAAFFVNLDYARRRYHCGSKVSLVLQYLAVLGMVVTILVQTGPKYSLVYFIHWISAAVFAVANAYSLMFLFIGQVKRDRRFRAWIIGGVIFTLVSIPCFALESIMSGFVEMATMLFALAAVYGLNYIMKPRWDDPRQKEKQAALTAEK